MASTPPICPEVWKTGGKGSNTCDLLNQLLLVSERLFTLNSWMFTPGPNCKLSPDFVSAFASTLQPIGSVIWAPTELPVDEKEWIKADGVSRSKEDYPELYAAYGESFGVDPDSAKFMIPNINGRILLGSGKRVQNLPGTFDPENPDPDLEPGTINYVAGKMGGLDEVALVPAETPLGEHKHGVSGLNSVQEPPITGEASDTGGQPWNSAGVPCKTFDGAKQDLIIKPSPPVLVAGYNRVTHVTTEPIGDKTTDPADPHYNMPPYFAGVYYIRASHQVSGMTVPPA